MPQVFGCRYFRSAFAWCVPIGALAGLIGLGGGEFRLPVLMHSLGFAARSAIPINLAVSLITLAFALATRGGAVSLSDVAPHAPEISGLVCGGIVTAFFGPRMVQSLTNARLIRIIGCLLAALGALLCVEALVPFSHLEMVSDYPGRRFAIGAMLGSGIGLVSSLLGVAGGELLIPVLIFFYGADIRTAGSASILISLCLIAVGLWRYWRMDAFPRGLGIWRIMAAMSSGSIVGAVLGGLAVSVVPVAWLQLLLGAVLIAAAAKTIFAKP